MTIPWDDEEFLVFLKHYFSHKQALANEFTVALQAWPIIFDKLCSPVIYLEKEFDAWKGKKALNKAKEKLAPHNTDETSFTKKPSTLNREKLVFR